MIDQAIQAWGGRFRSWADRNVHLANIARLGGGTAIGQGLVFVATPAITRLYRPADIGLAGLFSSLFLLASTFACMRYECAIGVAAVKEERDLLALLSCWLTGPIALLAVAALAVLINTGAFGFGALPYASLPAMGILVVLTGIFAALRFWFVARQGFGSIASALLRQGFGRALFPILVAPLGWGWGGLVAGEVAGRLLGLGDLLKTAGPRLLAAHRLGWQRLYECLVRYRQFPLTYVPGVVLTAISSALPLPLMASMYGISAAGAFALAQRVILLPSSLICSALADVYQARLVEAVRRDPQSVRALIKAGALRLALLGIVLYVPIAILALVSFPWAFGAEWAAAGAVAAALAPLAVSGVITNPLSRAIFVSRVPQWKLLSDAARLALPAGGLYVTARLGHAMVATTLVYAVLGVLADCVYLLIIWHTVAPVRQRRLA